jgi:hypothetical protein
MLWVFSICSMIEMSAELPQGGSFCLDKHIYIYIHISYIYIRIYIYIYIYLNLNLNAVWSHADTRTSKKQSHQDLQRLKVLH